MHPDDLSAPWGSDQLATSEEFPGYGFSADGWVWSFKTNREIKSYVMPNGKNKWYVSLNGKAHLLHRVLLTVFRGPCPPGLIGCHNDDDPSNNHIDNLRWDTKQSNVDDRKNDDRYAVGSKHWKAKLTEVDVIQARAWRAGGMTYREIGERLGVHLGTIYDAIHRKWKHLP